MAVELDVDGATLQLLAGRAAYWRERQTLLVADVHLGKDATFRAEAVALPLGSTEADLERLARLVRTTGAERLLVLGDLYHAAAGMTPGTVEAIRAWREAHASLDVVLVRGNHDRDAGPSPDEFNVDERVGPVIESPFAFRHEPPPRDDSGAPAPVVVAGHVHPVAVLRGRAGQRERLPCFHRTPAALTLPAFGEFTGGHEVDVYNSDRVFVVAGDEVLEVSLRNAS